MHGQLCMCSVLLNQIHSNIAITWRITLVQSIKVVNKIHTADLKVYYQTVSVVKRDKTTEPV